MGMISAIRDPPSDNDDNDSDGSIEYNDKGEYDISSDEWHKEDEFSDDIGTSKDEEEKQPPLFEKQPPSEDSENDSSNFSNNSIDTTISNTAVSNSETNGSTSDGSDH